MFFVPAPYYELYYARWVGSGMYVVLHVIRVVSRCACAGRGYDARPRSAACPNLPLQTPDQSHNAADEHQAADNSTGNDADASIASTAFVTAAPITTTTALIGDSCHRGGLHRHASVASAQQGRGHSGNGSRALQGTGEGAGRHHQRRW